MHARLLMIVSLGAAAWFCCASGGCPLVEQPLAAGDKPLALELDLGELDIHGIDVSDHQGLVDFERVKCAGATFVFLRASQGITFKDDMYQRNYQAAKAAGLIVGAYHFYMTDDDPKYQLENFIQSVHLSPGDLPPVVDIEVMNQNSLPDLDHELKLFLDALEQHYGVRPIIYSGERFANAELKDFGDYPLWLAEYEVAKPTLPSGWDRYHFWQFSEKGEVDGVGGAVDTSRFNGSGADLLSLLIRDEGAK